MTDEADLHSFDRPTAQRTIAAPAADLFDAWITPELVETWWGPEGFKARVHELDARPGGRYAIEMIAPSGASCVMAGVYRVVERPSRLVFEVHDHCNLDLPDGIEPQIEHSLVEVRFEEQDGQTAVSLFHTGLNEDYGWLAAASWLQSLEKIGVRAGAVGDATGGKTE